MARRKVYSNLTKIGQYRPKHIDGQTLYKVFQCINPDCTEIITIKKDDIDEDYSIICPKCGYEHYSGGEQHLFDFSMDVNDDNGNATSVQEGEFIVSHDEYIENAPLYKYCLLCNTLKPIECFHKRKVLKSGRQGECITCKTNYNAIKNGTRTADQHFESSQKRRLLIDIAGSNRVSRKAIEQKYELKCFNCGRDLSGVTSNREKPIDHTLPVYYLWPATTNSGTLLCRVCNGNKTGKWPSEFYSDVKLHELAIHTGFDYRLLSGSPQYNPAALRRLQNSNDVDALLIKNSGHMDEVCKLRNRLLADTGIDFFQYATALSETWISYANSLMK